MCEPEEKEAAKENDKIDDDVVDPRVQIELERLNTATDGINKLEVDLDEARLTFRQMLCESTITMENLSKKLGACIEKSKPYYDARFKAKEALKEAQKAAIRFERANSQHTAAKEMVYLAEEGLRMEGRCFDHAWQEMLNHATERVNESENERVLSETQHRHLTAVFHSAEHNVKILQSELKRAIAKSSMDARRNLLLINSTVYRHNLLFLPYYESKAQFHQMLENQRNRVSVLERAVAEAKMTYAEALRNLEKISDEIHQTRRYDGSTTNESTGQQENAPITPESSETGSADSVDYLSDKYPELPDKLSPKTAVSNTSKIDLTSNYSFGTNSFNLSSTEPRKYIKRDKSRNVISSSSSSSSSSWDKSCQEKTINKNTQCKNKKDELCINKENGIDESIEQINVEEWAEIKLTSPSENDCEKNGFNSDEEDSIPYNELSPDSVNVPENEENHIATCKKYVKPLSLTKTGISNYFDKPESTKNSSMKSRRKLDRNLTSWITGNSSDETSSCNSSRRKSLDTLWNGGTTSERVKDLLNQGMMMLNISSLAERRSSEPKASDNPDSPVKTFEKVDFRGKKAPSTLLDKSMSYLNADDETSDCDSLASGDMLSEDQIASLMMEPDVNQVCQEVLGTPLVEICPLFHQLQQQN
ncbi:SH3 domain-binding protein 5-like isoform X1 [Aphidius gifuensis]|uniref:SH3 domain-binding protein 5-like isoform X1 n=1 Tax=Aphidius gifuensis TaxID=684658 RepID=UPI001CDBB311|nr:SH3 domain-binding protein 5-like isoform X1 [Aphidius gifuensis]